jgi:putative DNA methylase
LKQPNNITDQPRLIERAFPLKQASLDSVHEKNVRHGHISTLHIWPARRPLAACRAALIATLLPDPGDPEERRRLIERIGGRVVSKIEKKKLAGKSVDIEREETIGGILHWGRESDPDLQFFRDEIRKAYGGRAPRVLDPFAGGGAIPLEAMRLGCEVTAIDINPVAWFILKCTLEYPQKLAGQKRPLPKFVLHDRDFMESFLKAQGFKGATLRTQLERMGLGEEEKNDLTPNPFPHGKGNQSAGAIDGKGDQNTGRSDDSESASEVSGFPLRRGEGQGEVGSDRRSNSQAAFNLGGDAGLFEADLAWHVRAWGWWVLQRAKADLERFYPTIDGKPTVAYLWARTVKCKNCRATMPLLKTKWLCKKDNKRVLLKVEPNADKTGPTFSILRGEDAATQGGNGAQRREYDKKLGAGTMSRSGATCVCCGLPSMKMEDIRFEGKAGRLGAIMTAVVVDGPGGKEYRLPTDDEIRLSEEAAEEVEQAFAVIPFGILNEALPESRARGNSGFRVLLYGIDTLKKLFVSRQVLALATIVRHSRLASEQAFPIGKDEWSESVLCYLAAAIDRLAEFSTTNATWAQGGEFIRGTHVQFALPMVWDFAEVSPLSHTTGGYAGSVEWVSLGVEHLLHALAGMKPPTVISDSVLAASAQNFEVVLTDPPYYDEIAYSDVSDFFYAWLRRTLHGLSPEIDQAFREPLGPKWNAERNDGELIDDSSRFGGDRAVSKAVYEEGMFRAFLACDRALVPDGRMVVVFANKSPDAWETLVSAIIRAGFTVDGSWPIQTERQARTRALSAAALASSVWLVCRKRPEAARPGWDNRVLDEMRENIHTQLREYWDAGIRGPDFVWAATGPAMEAYSKHPVVKKANEPNATMEVSEFLRAVRRIVVDFVVGRVLTHNGDATVTSGLDDVTTYYLLHRHDFGMNDAPIGACILYAISCGLSDHELADRHEILQKTGGQAEPDEDEEPTAEADIEVEEGTGSKVRLRPWNKRIRKSMGYDGDAGTAAGKPAPLIDQVHRMMHLWRAGDLVRVDEYLDARGLRRNALFHQLLQALIELAPAATEERSLLESISNHISAKPVSADDRQGDMFRPKEA